MTPVMMWMPFLIGIAVEGMYRGILLPRLLKKKSVNAAIFISALWLSLLHSLNLLAGQPFQAVLIRLLLTFLTGLYYGAMYLRIRRLTPLVLQHGLWDLVAFSGILQRVSWKGPVMLGISTLQAIFAAVLMRSYRGKNADAL